MKLKPIVLLVTALALVACQTAPVDVLSEKIVQINYKFSGPRSEFERVNLPYAKPIADTRGLRWKIWVVNEEESEAGGIYLFEDAAAAQAFLTGPIIAALKSSTPTVNIKSFDVMAEHTLVTRGPVK
jgi:hypothetical protein